MIHGFIIVYTNSHLGAKMKPYRIKKRFGGMGTYTLSETKSKLAPENGWQREERRSGFLLGYDRPIFRGKLAVSFRECMFFLGIFFELGYLPTTLDSNKTPRIPW